MSERKWQQPRECAKEIEHRCYRIHGRNFDDHRFLFFDKTKKKSFSINIMSIFIFIKEIISINNFKNHKIIKNIVKKLKKS